MSPSSLSHLSPITNHGQCLRCCKMAAPGSPGRSSDSVPPRLASARCDSGSGSGRPPPTQAASGTQHTRMLAFGRINFLGDLFRTVMCNILLKVILIFKNTEGNWGSSNDLFAALPIPWQLLMARGFLQCSMVLARNEG